MHRLPSTTTLVPSPTSNNPCINYEQMGHLNMSGSPAGRSMMKGQANDVANNSSENSFIGKDDLSSNIGCKYETNSLPSNMRPKIPALPAAIYHIDDHHYSTPLNTAASVLGPSDPTKTSHNQTPAFKDKVTSAVSSVHTPPRPVNISGNMLREAGVPCTVANQLKYPKPMPRAGFLVELPEHAFVMPVGPPISFTIADILVILPNWFKNQQICARFQNNGLSSAVHVAILQEHRNLALPGPDFVRAKDGISDIYRKTMRRTTPGWKRSNHKAPNNWNPKDLTVNQFLPDTARRDGYTAREPIPFKQLMTGIKQLPQGSDAGDLTRALDFALHNQKTGDNGGKEEYLFPDDLHAILRYIEYTFITDDHLDVAVIGRYDKVLKDITAADRKRHRDLESLGLPTPPPNRRYVAKTKTPEYVLPPQSMKNIDEMHSQSWYGGQYMPPMISEHQQKLASPVHRSDEYAEMPHSYIHLPLPVPSALNSSHLEHFMHGFNGTLKIDGNKEHPFTPLSQSSEVTKLAPLKSALIVGSSNVDAHVADKTSPEIPGAICIPSGVDATFNATTTQIQARGAEMIFSSEDDMDAMIAQHQDHDYVEVLTSSLGLNPFSEDTADLMAGITTVNRTQYPDSQLLQDCIEAQNLENHSNLARAARWCRNPHNHAWKYVVGHVDYVLDLAALLGEAEPY